MNLIKQPKNTLAAILLASLLVAMLIIIKHYHTVS